MIYVIRFLDLLGSHVLQRSHDLPRVRQCEILSRRVQQFRQTKISDFHVAIGVHKNVLWFDVPMNNPFVMSILECVTNLWNDEHCLVGVQSLRLYRIP